MNIIEKLLGVRIVRAKTIGLIFEEVYLEQLLKLYQVDCVFDVGANEGQYATMLRRRVGYTGTIVSFEPIPVAADILRKKSDSDPNWHVEQLALDKAARKTTFNIMAASQFSSLHQPSNKEVDLFVQLNKVKQQIAVETVTLKEVFTKYQNLVKFKRPFLKMDTQGHDLAIAEGGGEALRSFVGLQSELPIKPIYEETTNFTTILDFYRSQDFELSALVPNNQGHFPRLIEIDCIMYNKNVKH